MRYSQSTVVIGRNVSHASKCIETLGWLRGVRLVWRGSWKLRRMEPAQRSAILYILKNEAQVAAKGSPAREGRRQ